MAELKRDQLVRVPTRGRQIANDEYQGEVEHLVLRRIWSDLEDTLMGALTEESITSMEVSVEEFRAKLVLVKAGRFPVLAEVS